ncbi:MAG: hypothetical protein IKO00_02220 [Oscillospiraceae bacterium]|nr:hypothetical protein [Oscillospiraceae bacterium]
MMPDREKVIEGLNDIHAVACGLGDDECYLNSIGIKQLQTLINDATELLRVQMPRVMCAAEVADCPEGTVLWVEERQGVTWNLFPLEIETSSSHPDTRTDYLFFITYHDIRKFECSEYNQTWRCWTSRPTDGQRKAVKWND